MPTLHIRQLQLEKLNRLLNEVWERNSFYTHKWCAARVPHHEVSSLEELRDFPFTTRAELLADQSARPPLGTNLTFSAENYKRIHRSSGTTRAPIFWGDTAASWRWVIRCSQALFLLADITPGDRLFFAMHFGASSGPWIIYEGACQLGCGCFTTEARDAKTQIALLQQFSANVLVAGPNDLFQLARFAKTHCLDPATLGVRKIISFGKNGWKFDAIRQHAKEVWNAQAFDRYGMTEAGSIAAECIACPGGMHLLESEFIAEVIDSKTGQPVAEGALGELVLTNLGRAARPIIRYRTGDLVRLVRNVRCSCGRTDAMLVGGVTRLSQ
jgi:phenylacetate-CoA ligase